jgi:hypothetical protein
MPMTPKCQNKSALVDKEICDKDRLASSIRGDVEARRIAVNIGKFPELLPFVSAVIL